MVKMGEDVRRWWRCSKVVKMFEGGKMFADGQEEDGEDVLWW